MTRAEARQECLEAQALARQLGNEKSIQQIIREVRGPELPAEPVEWRDSSVDRWGAPAQRQVVARAWGGGNCLKACIASILGAAIDRVPDPSDFSEDWLDRYSQRLAAQTGYRLDKIPAHACPPRSAHQLWIATIDERPDPSDHCVVARGAFVVHDPSGTYQGSLPMHRLVDGLIVAPTKRIIPVFSLHGRHGSAVVPA
jgi:hypothetical protein